MRIGLTLPMPGENPDLATVLGQMERADARGFHAVWMPSISARGFDALSLLALAGPRTRRLELGSFAPPGEDAERTWALLGDVAREARPR